VRPRTEALTKATEFVACPFLSMCRGGCSE